MRGGWMSGHRILAGWGPEPGRGARRSERGLRCPSSPHSLTLPLQEGLEVLSRFCITFCPAPPTPKVFKQFLFAGKGTLWASPSGSSRNPD